MSKRLKQPVRQAAFQPSAWEPRSPANACVRLYIASLPAAARRCRLAIDFWTTSGSCKDC